MTRLGLIWSLVLSVALVGSIKANENAAPQLLPRPDVDGQLYAVNGFKLSKCSFEEETEVVLLFYSASWCPNCKQIAKALKELYPSIRKDHPTIEFVTYSMNKSVSGRAEHLRKSNYRWPAIGPTAAQSPAWQIEVYGGIPQFQAFRLGETSMTAITTTHSVHQVLKIAIASIDSKQTR
jgi:thiol-disulfide isomerase/thioredoxin